MDEYIKLALTVWLVGANFVGFAMMGADKLKAKRAARRIPEATLLWAAALGGSIGCIAGMYLFRHKTRHKKFTIGLPLILLAQAALAVWLLRSI